MTRAGPARPTGAEPPGTGSALMRFNPVDYPFPHTSPLGVRIWRGAAIELIDLAHNPEGFGRPDLPFNLVCMNVGERPTPFAIRTLRRHERTYSDGRFLMLPSGMPTFYAWNGPTRCLTLRLDDELLQDHAAAHLRGGKGELRERHAAEAPRLERVMRLLREEVEGRQPNPLYAESLVAAIVALVLDGDVPSRGTARLSPAQARRVRELIEAQLDRDLPLDLLAREAGLSRFHFARAFKEALGEPPHRFVIRRRLERAREMLADPRRSITEIALDLGFASHSHFTETFRRHLGVTPSAFRQEQCVAM